MSYYKNAETVSKINLRQPPFVDNIAKNYLQQITTVLFKVDSKPRFIIDILYFDISKMLAFI
jgi:hypothetical protein